MFGRSHPPAPNLNAQPIEKYALIGDCETAALVGSNGSIDWLCWPTFSSGACFAALLGTPDHGHWRIAPTGKILATTRRYLPDTLIVETTFVTPTGTVSLLDFMPPRGDYSDVVRILRCPRGKVELRMELAIRFDYGRTVPWVTHIPEGLRAISGPDMVVLRTPVKLTGEGQSTVAEFTLHAGQQLPFTLTYASSIGEDPSGPTQDPRPFSPYHALDDTLDFWRGWNGQNIYQGPHTAAVRRSLMTLKALTYRPSGGMVAAVTTSLPEQIGGDRNWDYRFCWIRDASFTLLALLRSGYKDEAASWRRWLLRAIAGDPAQIQTIYGIRGERQLNEWPAGWLPGYENSKPINIGNAAAEQFQLDIFGEVAIVLSQLPEADRDIELSSGSVQTQLIDHLCRVWDEPDDGIWETRGGRKHFTYSKVMAWVALDRAIIHQQKLGGSGDLKLWRKNRDLIHEQVLRKGFNKRLNAFTQSYGTKELDASCLLIGLVGFLPMDDPRIVGTVNAIQRRLMPQGLVLRYDTQTSSDGLPAGEGAFLACSFWMASNLWLIDRKPEAEALFNRLLALRNDVGLLSEEWNPTSKRMVGNFPQALSHLALVHTALIMSGAVHP